MRRRDLLASIPGLSVAVTASRAGEEERPRPLVFPADFGAHPQARTEWWYATGTLEVGIRRFGFQITFFRAASGISTDHPSRFAASQIVFAHAALTDLEARRLRHDDRIARSGFGVAEAAIGDTHVILRDWRFDRDGAIGASRYRARVPAGTAGFGFDLRLAATQPLLLQGIGRLVAQGPSTRSLEPLLQRAAARGRRDARARRPRARGARPRLARSRMERRLPRSRCRRLGLDRHEPRRRLRR